MFDHTVCFRPGPAGPALPSLSAICLGQDDFPDFNLPPSTFSGAGIASWSVDWGNGSDTSLLSFNPALDTVGTSYPDLGLYVITVEALGDNGCVNADRDSLFVGTNPSIGSALPGTSITIAVRMSWSFPSSRRTTTSMGRPTPWILMMGFGDVQSPAPGQCVPHLWPEQLWFRYAGRGAKRLRRHVQCEQPLWQCHQHRRAHPDSPISGTGHDRLTDVCVGPSFEYEALGSGLIDAHLLRALVW